MLPPRTFRLADIASELGGEVLGDAHTTVRGLASLVSAGPQDLSFLSRGRFRAQLGSTRAAAVIVGAADRDATRLPRIVCDDPYAYYARVAELFNPRVPPEPGVHASAVVEAGARVMPSASVGPLCHVAKRAFIGERVALGAGCAIGEGASIGEDSRLYALVSVYHECVVGKRAIIHSGAIIGADGFGMAREQHGWRKIPQLGRAVIGDDVEIGANTTIDRGALEDTVVEDGVKMDNQIQVGHNVHIGAHTAIAGCVGIAGSARIGRRCTIGGAASILGHLEIADDVHIGALGVVSRSITGPGEYAGFYPIQEKSRWARNAVLLRNLEDLARRVQALERELERRPPKE
jgi:UDP-3-O-[3-hydroxymyristoyl] glucosamine N-acyltransferase